MRSRYQQLGITCLLLLAVFHCQANVFEDDQGLPVPTKRGRIVITLPATTSRPTIQTTPAPTEITECETETTKASEVTECESEATLSPEVTECKTDATKSPDVTECESEATSPSEVTECETDATKSPDVTECETETTKDSDVTECESEATTDCVSETTTKPTDPGATTTDECESTETECDTTPQPVTQPTAPGATTTEDCDETTPPSSTPQGSTTEEECDTTSPAATTTDCVETGETECDTTPSATTTEDCEETGETECDSTTSPTTKPSVTPSPATPPPTTKPPVTPPPATPLPTTKPTVTPPPATPLPTTKPPVTPPPATPLPTTKPPVTPPPATPLPTTKPPVTPPPATPPPTTKPPVTPPRATTPPTTTPPVTPPPATPLPTTRPPILCCPPGGIWSFWEDPSTQCTAPCGACATWTVTRKCLSDSYGCKCSGSETRQDICNPVVCSFPLLSCCGSYSASVRATFHECNITIPMPEFAGGGDCRYTGCCPSRGVWTEWYVVKPCSKYRCGACGIEQRKRICLSAPFGCPCEGPSTWDAPCLDKSCDCSNAGQKISEACTKYNAPCCPPYTRTDNGTCGVPLVDYSVPVNNPQCCPNEYPWSPWSDWTSCNAPGSKICGYCIKKTRQRVCTAEKFGCKCPPGPRAQSQQCGSDVCQQNDMLTCCNGQPANFTNYLQPKMWCKNGEITLPLN